MTTPQKRQASNYEQPTAKRSKSPYDQLDYLLAAHRNAVLTATCCDATLAEALSLHGVCFVHAAHMADDGERLWQHADVGFSECARVPIVDGRGATADLARASKNMGNRSFGFCYAQRCHEDDLRYAKIAGAKVPFEFQPGDHANRKWLDLCTELYKLIVDVGRFTTDCTESDLCVVSFDAIKAQRNAFPKSSAEKALDATPRVKLELTKPHIDSYEVGRKTIQRRQMAFEVQEPRGERKVRRALMYVPGSHTEEVRGVLGEIAGKNFARNGFIGLPHKDARLCEILHRYAVGFDGTALSVWVDGLVHFEAFAEPDTTRPGLTKVVHTVLQRRALKNIGVPDPTDMPLVRSVCGTVIVQEQYLTSADWNKLMEYSRTGWTPSVYRRAKYAKNCPVLRHMVNFKTTQCGYARRLNEREAGTWPGQL